MRLTITLDRDVEKRLEKLAQTRKETKRSLINNLLREGLDRMNAIPASKANTFATQGSDLGQCRYGNIDDVSEVLAVAEGEQFK